jgi:hypothetical protein
MKNENNNEEINKIENVNIDDVKSSIEEIEKERMHKKHLPKEEQNKINKRVFENIIIAVIVMAFLYCVGLGSLNIESDVFKVDLNVFSMGLIIFTIILFEIGFKKESGNIGLHGIECLGISIFMLFSNYIYSVDMRNFPSYVSMFSYLFAIYLTIKSIIICIKMKKKYIASLSDIDEIIKK